MSKQKLGMVGIAGAFVMFEANKRQVPLEIDPVRKTEGSAISTESSRPLLTESLG